MPHNIKTEEVDAYQPRYFMHRSLVTFFYFIKHWRAFLAEFLFLLCWTGYVVIIGGDNMVGGRALLPVFPVMFLLTVSGIKHLLSRFNVFQKLGRSSIALSLISGIAAASFFLYNYSNHENISRHITDMKNKRPTSDNSSSNASAFPKFVNSWNHFALFAILFYILGAHESSISHKF